MSTAESTPKDAQVPEGTGGPGPFSEEEIAQVTAAPNDAELDDVDVAEISEKPEPEVSLEKMVQKGKRLSLERARTVLESILFVADKPLTLDQLFETTGI